MHIGSRMFAEDIIDTKMPLLHYNGLSQYFAMYPKQAK